MTKERKQYIIKMRPHIYKDGAEWVWVLRCYLDDGSMTQATRWQGRGKTVASLEPYMGNRWYHLRRIVQEYNAWARRHNGE